MRPTILFGSLALACSGAGPTASINPPPPPPPGAAALALYTTLDGPNAVMSPQTGSGSGAVISTTPANDFVAARVGLGLHADAIGERVLLRQTDGQKQNVELDRGTIEFWYRPNYNHNDNLKYSIAGTGNWLSTGGGAPGAIHLGKHNSSNNNGIFLIFYDANGVRWEHDVAVTDYSWRAGDWLLVRLTWDFGVAAGVQNLHLYVNGSELRLSGQVSRGPQPVPAERQDQFMYIGSRDLAGSIIPNGLYDEVRVWDRAIPPS